MPSVPFSSRRLGLSYPNLRLSSRDTMLRNACFSISVLPRASPCAMSSVNCSTAVSYCSLLNPSSVVLVYRVSTSGRIFRAISSCDVLSLLAAMLAALMASMRAMAARLA